MTLNMLSGFMVTRSRQVLWALGVSLYAILTATSCEKVPLLAPSGSTITLTTATSALGFNGTADISAQVLEAAGTPPHSGTHVTFSTNLGTVDPAEVQTDVNGRATTRFFAGTSSGIATITAASGGASVAAANTVKIAVGSAAVSAVVASANPSIVSSRGGNSTISARVTDAGGNALAGIPVTFTTDAGSVAESVANTNSSGIATTVLTTNRTAKVTATAGVTTTTTTPPPTTGGGTGTTTTTAPSSSTVTVTVNVTASITLGTPSPATPQVGQTVSFPIAYPASTTGASAIVRVDVDWGDGRRESFNSTPSAVSHAYGAAASYLVVVTGFDALGDTATASQSVTVNPRAQPTVAISATPSNPSVGQTVTFSITATPQNNNPITNMTVDFGDGQSVSLPGNATTVQHVYGAEGSKTVTATATDTSGASGSASIVIVVGNTPGPTASFTVNPTTGTISTNFQFDASASTGTGLNYQWNFGDSFSGSGVTTSHTYQSTGSKTVTLTVTDNQGRTATANRTVTVNSTVR
jgi:PKD repeat protein